MSKFFEAVASRTPSVRAKFKSRIESGEVKASDPAFGTTFGKLAGLGSSTTKTTAAQKKTRLALKRRKGRPGSVLIGSRSPLGEAPIRRPAAGSTLG